MGRLSNKGTPVNGPLLAEGFPTGSHLRESLFALFAQDLPTGSRRREVEHNPNRSY